MPLILGEDNPFKRYTQLLYQDQQPDNLPLPNVSNAVPAPLSGDFTTTGIKKITEQNTAPHVALEQQQQEDQLMQPRPLNNNLTQLPTELPSDRLKATLNAMPTRENYKPSLGRKIAASLTGAGVGATQGAQAGFQTAQGINNLPFKKAMEGWQDKVGKESNLYNTDVTERQRANELAMKNVELGIKSRTADAAEMRGQASLFKALQPDAQERLINWYKTNPEEAKQFMLYHAGRLGYDQQVEIQNLKDAAAQQRVNTTVQGSKDNTQSRIDSSENIAAENRASRERIAALERGLREKLHNTGKGPTPEQQIAAKQLAGERVKMRHPEWKNSEGIYGDRSDAFELDPKGRIVINTDDASIRTKIINELGAEERSINSEFTGKPENKYTVEEVQ